jgi:hypothetical protein
MRQTRTATRPVRLSAAVRGAWGCVLLLAPAQALTLCARRPVDGPAVVVARVLGARQVLQSAVTAFAPTVAVTGLSAIVDALHGSTSAALAVVSPQWRRVALVDMAIAASLAASSWSCHRGLGK